MKERIRLIQEQLGLSQIEFANKLGISPASLSSIYTGRTNPTNNHVMAIHKAFPQINVNWLMFGEGDMTEGGVVGAALNEMVRRSIIMMREDLKMENLILPSVLQVWRCFLQKERKRQVVTWFQGWGSLME